MAANMNILCADESGSPRPAIRPHLRAVRISPDAVFLLGEHEAYRLHGSTYARLVPLLDGSRSVDELGEALGGNGASAAVSLALARLGARGFLAADSSRELPSAAAFWSGLGVEPSRARQHLDRAAVSAYSLNGESAAPLVAALEEIGVSTSTFEGWGEGFTRSNTRQDLSVVVTSDYLNDDLDRINREALDSGRPWLLVKPTGAEPWIGPLFVPGETACWQCLATRLQHNRAVEAWARAHSSGQWRPVSIASLPMTRSLALIWAATEIARLIGVGSFSNATSSCSTSSPLHGALVSLHLGTMETSSHSLVRSPQCPSCGQADVQGPTGLPMELQPRRVGPVGRCGYRVTPPEKTYERLRHLLSPVTGIVNGLSKIQAPEDAPIHNWVALHAGPAPRDEQSMRDARLRQSWGKGSSGNHSRASALCEALERYSGVCRGDEAVRSARYTEIADEAVHPRSLLHFSDRQLAKRPPAHTPPAARPSWTPDPFDESRPADWSATWSLSRDRVRWVPSAFCWCDYPSDFGHRFCSADSNGCASGNVLEEAILHGFLEVVERDAIAIWWYNRVRRPRLDLQSWGDRWLLEVEAHYLDLGWTIDVLDLTHDLGIATFAAVVRPGLQSPGVAWMGVGCHLEPAIALSRAVSEAGQQAGISAAACRSGSSRWAEARTPNGCPVTEVWPHLVPADDMPQVAPDRHPSQASGDLLEDIRHCVEIADGIGLETLVLDQTRKDAELPVVKVIVPGLRPHYPRFGPGRLYDVPMQLGWLDVPTAEECLTAETPF